MKPLNAAFVFAVLLHATLLHAQYSTDFYVVPDSVTPGPGEYLNGYSLDGQPIDPPGGEWATNDPQSLTSVSVVGGLSADANDGWAIIGGQVPLASFLTPAVPVMDVWRPFTLPLGGSAAKFTVDMLISPSGGFKPNVDTFRWKFQQGDGTNILTVNFVPSLVDRTKVSYTDFLGNTFDSYDPNLMAPSGVLYNTRYEFEIAVDGLGTATPTLQVFSDPEGPGTKVKIVDVTLPATTPAGLERIAASWQLFDTTAPYSDYGLNTLFFDNYTVVIPEPSTIALVLVGAVTLLGVRRFRRGKASV